MAPGEKSRNPLVNLMAGGIAGVIESTCCHPLDTIKTRRGKHGLWHFMFNVFQRFYVLASTDDSTSRNNCRLLPFGTPTSHSHYSSSCFMSNGRVTHTILLDSYLSSSGYNFGRAQEAGMDLFRRPCASCRTKDSLLSIKDSAPSWRELHPRWQSGSCLLKRTRLGLEFLREEIKVSQVLPLTGTIDQLQYRQNLHLRRMKSQTSATLVLIIGGEESYAAGGLSYSASFFLGPSASES